MWNKPYGLKEGFLIGGGLVVTGVLLQLTIGSIDWDLFAWPVNIFTLVILALVSLLMWVMRKSVYAFRFLGTLQAAVPVVVYAVALTLLMGITRQMSGHPADGDPLGLTYMLGQWSFVLTYLYMVIILTQTVLNQLCHLARIDSLLSHVGLLVAVTCGTLGTADMQRLKMVCVEGQPEWRAMTKDQEIKELPLAIELKKFIMETYADSISGNGSPKRFASEVQILTRSGKNLRATIDVNKPVEVEGWKIYQYGYDTDKGPYSKMSIFELVTDPWMPWVYAGIYMMMAGALGMMFFGSKRKNTLNHKP